MAIDFIRNKYPCKEDEKPSLHSSSGKFRLVHFEDEGKLLAISKSMKLLTIPQRIKMIV